MMTSRQRQAAFERYFSTLARSRSRTLGLTYVGTIRKLPPPPFPGEDAGVTRYYLNAIAKDGSGSRLVELGGRADAALRKAETWVESGRGPVPVR